MNNVFFLLVDSVFSECIGTGRTEVSSTPFIDKLIDEGLYAPSVYSYGPYTDAATRGLYCGNPSLDDYGYFFGINSPEENHFKTFKDNGYETIGLYYPYYLIGSKVENYIDHSVFIGGFVYKSEWCGKFEYYAKIQQQRDLSETEYALLFKHLDLMFDCWSLFYQKLEESQNSGRIVKDFLNTDEQPNCRKKLNNEFIKFTNDRKLYVDEILKLGLDHPLNNVDEYCFDRTIDADFIENDVYKSNKLFFRKLANLELSRNLINNRIEIKKVLHNKRYGANYALCMLASRYSQMLSKRSGWQYSASMYKQVDAALKEIDNRNTNNPFYLSLHTEEPHNYIAFFSYDVQDKNVIDEEMEYLKPLIDNCGKNFKGSLIYQLSLRYVDLCVKRLFDGLEKRGLLDSTTVVITADHGSSYTFYPVRESVVNNFHKENYKTPLLIWSKNMHSSIRGCYPKMYMAEDTMATICDVVGLRKPNQYKGLNISKEYNGREYVLTEYMGPGVPDMLSREVWMSIRDENYMLGFKIPIRHEFTIDYCVEAYDLKFDSIEANNIKNAVDFSSPKIIKLVGAVQHRFNEIQSNSTKILSNISSLQVIKETVD